jgi:hypothetical protein
MSTNQIQPLNVVSQAKSDLAANARPSRRLWRLRFGSESGRCRRMELE